MRLNGSEHKSLLGTSLSFINTRLAANRNQFNADKKHVGVKYWLDIQDDPLFNVRIDVKISGQSKLYTVEDIKAGVYLKLVNPQVSYMDEKNVYFKAEGIEEVEEIIL